MNMIFPRQIARMLFETPTVSGIAVGTVVSPPRVEETPVSYAFFSKTNVESLHTSIRYQVYVRTGNIIDRQGDNQLRIVMAAVYDNSQTPTLESAIAGRTISIVKTLNARVINKAVNEIINAINMHRFYLNDVSSPVPDPIERSQFADQRKGTKTLELPIGF